MSSETPQVLTIPDPNTADYMEVPGTDTFRMLLLRGDVSQGPGTFMSRMQPGVAVPWHWHTPIEEFLVVKGACVVQLKGAASVRLETGAYSQLPAGHIHRFRSTDDGECIVFVVSEGIYDMHWVDDAGQEISEQEAALKSAEAGTDW